jgi:hypothetical protein
VLKRSSADGSAIAPFLRAEYKVSFKGNSAKGSLAISIVSGQLRASLMLAKFR